MARQDTALETAGAEFLVLGQLLILGVPAYKAYVNFPGYDLVATSLDGSRAARIQVKSRWATDAPHWLVKHLDRCDFVVLVGLNRGTRGKRALEAGEPEYYVLKAGQARSLIVDEERGWAKIRRREDDLAPYQRNWRVIQEQLGIS
jgi:hypothetical protein